MEAQTLLKGQPQFEAGSDIKYTLSNLVLAARPLQWTKNSVCLAALIFSGRLGNPAAVLSAILACTSFCLASSAIYLFNDLRDREQDRVHPRKRGRPIASGRLGTRPALIASLVLASGAIALSLALGPRFRWVLMIFLALNLLYCLVLRSLAIIDVMSIAAGFVLRVQGGIEAILAPQSGWMLLSMFFISLFLGFGKRRLEIAELKQHRGGVPQRPVLQVYSSDSLDILVALSATAALVCYSLYAVTIQTNETFLLTVLPVAFGIARCLMLIQTAAQGADEIFARDILLNLAVVIWAVLCVAILYLHLSLFPATHAAATAPYVYKT